MHWGSPSMGCGTLHSAVLVLVEGPSDPIFIVLSNLCRIINLLPSSHPLLSTYFLRYLRTRDSENINGISAIVGFRTFFPRDLHQFGDFTGHPIV